MTSDLRDSLLAARAEARRRIREFDAVLKDLTDARGDADSDDEHDPEGSTIAWDRAVAASTVEAAHVHLADVEAALARLDAGWDGTCSGCHRPIPAERLEVRPQTDRCVACARRPT